MNKHEVFLDSGALKVLLNSKKKQYATGQPVHNVSQQIQAKSLLVPLKKSEIQNYRQEKVDAILSHAFPGERHVLQGRCKRRDQLTKPDAILAKYNMDWPFSAWSIIAQFQFIVQIEEAGIVEQRRLKQVLGIGTDLLFRYDVAIETAKPIADEQTERILGLIGALNYDVHRLEQLPEGLQITDRSEYIDHIRLAANGFQDGLRHFVQSLMLRKIVSKHALLFKHTISDAPYKLRTPLPVKLFHATKPRVKVNRHQEVSPGKPLTLRGRHSLHQASPHLLNNELRASRTIQQQLDRARDESRNWLRDHCTLQLANASTLHRIQFGAEKLEKLIGDRDQVRLLNGMSCWALFAKKQHYFVQTNRYMKYKASLLVLQFARKRLYRLSNRSWGHWKSVYIIQREVESYAAQLVMQTMARQFLAACRVFHLRRKRAAAYIQLLWRFFYARKMAVRQRRYLKYRQSVLRVSMQYKVHGFRSAFVKLMQQNQRIRAIQRGFRCFRARKELERRKREYERRVQSCLQIQCALRQSFARRKLFAHREARKLFCVLRIQKKWRWIKFTSNLNSRINNKRARYNAAAICIQRAQRCSVAYRKMLGLRTTMEAETRKLVLQEMWQRDSIAKIERWWIRFQATQK